jgi:hypothetical protein
VCHRDACCNAGNDANARTNSNDSQANADNGHNADTYSATANTNALANSATTNTYSWYNANAWKDARALMGTLKRTRTGFYLATFRRSCTGPLQRTLRPKSTVFRCVPQNRDGGLVHSSMDTLTVFHYFQGNHSTVIVHSV